MNHTYSLALIILIVSVALVWYIWYSRPCTHRTVEVVRYHRETVRRDMQGKELYIDRHAVHCFVRCCHCRSLLNTRQNERLYETRG